MTESRVGRRWVGVVVTILIVAPAIAAVIALAGRRWYPTDDFAIIDLRVRDVFTAQTPLTGLYSRPGWNHPGPLMFWGMAPLSWLSGHAPWATRIGGALLQGIALVWLGVVTARRGVRLALAAGVVTSLTYLASNQWLFRQPWNLHIPVPYFVLFLFVAYLASIGETRQFIAMSIAATVLVSTHISYAPLVLAGFAYAVTWTLVDARRSGEAPVRWRHTAVVCGAVWAITWVAPLLDVILHWPGNLGKIARYFVGGGHSSVGLGDTLRYTADEFRWVPPWLGGSHRLQIFTGFAIPAPVGWLLVPAALIAVGVVAVRMTRSRDDARMLGLAALVLAAGVIAIAGADEPRSYTFQWRATVAAFLAVACVSALMTLVGQRKVGIRMSVVGIAVVATAWGSVAMTVAVVRRPSWLLDARDRDLRAVVRLVDSGPRPRGPIRVRSVGSSLPSLFDGVVNELDRRGIDVRVDPQRGRIFGAGRTLPKTTAAETWYVTEEGSQIPALLARKGARLLVATTPLPAIEERDLVAIQARVGRALDTAGHSDRRAFLDSSFVGLRLSGIPGIAPLDVFGLARLNTRIERSGRCRCAVVVVSAEFDTPNRSH